MEIIFLIIGTILLTLGVAVIVAETKARRDTKPVPARVIGFSLGKSNRPNLASFHPVAEYVGFNGRKYYVEGSVGSSAPLHGVGQAVQVLVNAGDPEKALLKSGLSYMLGGGLTFMGLVAVGLFWITFRLSIFSGGFAIVIIAGFVAKIRKAWRKEPLSLEAWREYRKSVLSTRVFTEESKDQISWADPLQVSSAIESYRRSNRFAVPVLLAMSLSLLFLSYHFYGKTRAFLDSADNAVGKVVELRERDSTDGVSTYSAVVEYNDRSGTSVRFVDSFSSSPPYYHSGQAVNVLYTRDDPSKAQIDRGIANYWLAALMGLPGVLLLLLGLHSARKQFARSR